MATPVWLIVLLSVLGFFAIVFGVRIKAILEYGEAFSLKISFLGIKYRILPTKHKKTDLSKYTVKKIRRREAARLKKERKNALKAKARAEKKAAEKKRTEAMTAEEKAAEKASKPSVIAIIRLATRLIKLFVPRFFKHIHIEIAKINIKIASEDAASTAIMYGAAYGALEALIATLHSVTHLHSLKNAEIHLEPDFIGDTVQAELKIAVSFRLASILGLLIRVGFKAVVGYIKAKPEVPKQTVRKPKSVKN